MHLRLEVLHGLPWALAQILFCDFGSRESVLASLGFDGSVDMLCCRVCVSLCVCVCELRLVMVGLGNKMMISFSKGQQ